MSFYSLNLQWVLLVALAPLMAYFATTLASVWRKNTREDALTPQEIRIAAETFKQQETVEDRFKALENPVRIARDIATNSSSREVQDRMATLEKKLISAMILLRRGADSDFQHIEDILEIRHEIYQTEFEQLQGLVDAQQRSIDNETQDRIVSVNNTITDIKKEISRTLGAFISEFSHRIDDINTSANKQKDELKAEANLQLRKAGSEMVLQRSDMSEHLKSMQDEFYREMDVYFTDRADELEEKFRKGCIALNRRLDELEEQMSNEFRQCIEDFQFHVTDVLSETVKRITDVDERITAHIAAITRGELSTEATNEQLNNRIAKTELQAMEISALAQDLSKRLVELEDITRELV